MLATQRRNQLEVAILIGVAVFARTVVVHAFVLATVDERVTDVAQLERQVVEQAEGAEAVMNEAVELVAQLDFGEEAALAQMAGGGHGEGEAAIGLLRLRWTADIVSGVDDRDVGILRADARRGIRPRAEGQIAVGVEWRGARRRGEPDGRSRSQHEDPDRASQPLHHCNPLLDSRRSTGRGAAPLAPTRGDPFPPRPAFTPPPTRRASRTAPCGP